VVHNGFTKGSHSSDQSVDKVHACYVLTAAVTVAAAAAGACHSVLELHC
jgi:hypothetical protein